jgi:hypothetical protein
MPGCDRARESTPDREGARCAADAVAAFPAADPDELRPRRGDPPRVAPRAEGDGRCPQFPNRLPESAIQGGEPYSTLRSGCMEGKRGRRKLTRAIRRKLSGGLTRVDRRRAHTGQAVGVLLPRVGGRAERRLTVAAAPSMSAAGGGRYMQSRDADFAARSGRATNGPRLIDQDSRSARGRAAVVCRP